ncbi:conserved hypothetical protein [uncultured delta proteobacterium]|uniref:Uncharacterized protein n=1 Tax=uncultured delta proteobacterium TaxID=34034 RepID=A0A212J9Y8_9DELT|nr:conserved hypothetical protein [uncultured delta proteobacterium]
MTQTPQPYFDLELFLRTAGETRIGGKETDECLLFWERWSASLFCKTVSAQGRNFLAVWLGEDVEQTVDAAWDESPSRGFLLNALAQTLCMCAVHEHLPEIEEAGCAPVPAPDPDLARALTEAGLPARAPARMDGEPEGGLLFARRYAVVTRTPFSGACDVCALRASCPRAGGNDSVIEFG